MKIVTKSSRIVPALYRKVVTLQSGHLVERLEPKGFWERVSIHIGGALDVVSWWFLANEFTISWKYQIGSSVRKGERIAILYPKGRFDNTEVNVILAGKETPNTLPFWEVTSPTNGILQGILISNGQHTESKIDTEFALISTIPKPLGPVKIFYSFASKDESLCRELEKHLSVLRREGFIANWYDRDVIFEINQQLDEYLNTAHIVLLLISPDFMDSDNCYSVGQMALQKHKKVIPVLLRPIDWQVSPIAKFQALPTNAKPITSWESHDEAFLNVAQGIRRVVWEVIEAHLTLLQSIISSNTILIDSYNTKILTLQEKIAENKNKLQKLSSEADRIQQGNELIQEENIEETPLAAQPEIPRKLQPIQDSETQVKAIETQRKNIEVTQANLQKQLDRARIVIKTCLGEQKQLIMCEKEIVELLSKIKF